MEFTPKKWKNDKSGGTKLNATALIDMEQRLSDYSGELASLGPVLNVKDSAYGAKGDASTDDAAAIQKALDAAAAAGGSIVFVPPGTYVVGTTLTIDDHVTLAGAGLQSSILRLKAGTNASLLKTERYGAGGEEGGARAFTITDLGFDGNWTEVSTSDPVVDLDGIAYTLCNTEIRNGDRCDLRSFQSRELDREFEATVFNLHLKEAGEVCMEWEGPTDSVLDTIVASRFSPPGVGAAIRAGAISTWSNCHAYGNSENGWQIESGFFNSCIAEGSHKGEVLVEGSSVIWMGGHVFAAGAEDGKIGFVFGSGANGPVVLGTFVEGCDNGAFKFDYPAYHGLVSGTAYSASGGTAITGEPAASVDFWGLTVNNMEFVAPGTELEKVFGDLTLTNGGAIDMGDRLKLEDRGGLPSQAANAAKVFAFNTTGGKTRLMSRFGSGSDVVLAREGGIQEIASATTISPEDAGPVTVVKLTGSTEVKKITATRPGHVLTLILVGTAKLVDGENLKLSAAGPVTADDTITLACDGTNWFEIGRATN